MLREIMVDADVVPMKRKLESLVDEVLCHDGYGQIQVDIRILKRGQKEVVLRCGKEYRFVVSTKTIDS